MTSNVLFVELMFLKSVVVMSDSVSSCSFKIDLKILNLLSKILRSHDSVYYVY